MQANPPPKKKTLHATVRHSGFSKNMCVVILDLICNTWFHLRAFPGVHPVPSIFKTTNVIDCIHYSTVYCSTAITLQLTCIGLFFVYVRPRVLLIQSCVFSDATFS